MAEQQQAPSGSSAQQTADILAHAAAEAAKPGADTDSAYECPFCVMMRKGGCEDPFKAFMACGEKADKGEIEMAECLKEFEALNKCMEANREVFDGLLTEMKEEEDKVTPQQDSGQQQQQQGAGSSGTTQAAAGATVHQQSSKQEPVPQQQQPSSSRPANEGSSSSMQSASSSGVPAAL